MFKKPDGIHGEAKREILIPSEGSAFSKFSRFSRFSRSSSTNPCLFVDLPPQKIARHDNQTSSKPTSEPKSVVTPDVNLPGCAFM